MPISLEKKSRLLLNNRSFDYCLEQTFSYDPWGNLTYRDPLFLEVQLFLSNRLLIENIYLWVIHKWRHQFFQTFELTRFLFLSMSDKKTNICKQRNFILFEVKFQFYGIHFHRVYHPIWKWLTKEVLLATMIPVFTNSYASALQLRQ